MSWRNTLNIPQKRLRELNQAQILLLKIVSVSTLMVIGATAAIIGFTLLIISALQTVVLGIIISSFALVAGCALTFAGYIWFTG